MPGIVTSLWFDSQAVEAARYYCSIFPNSTITSDLADPGSGHGSAGDVVTVDFVLDGRAFNAINGGPMFTFTEAVSLLVPCGDQQEVDHYWSALTADGGEESQCGWLKDKYGLSWQIVPTELSDLLGDPDRARADRAMRAMLEMRKIDIATVRAAAHGGEDPRAGT